MMAKNVKIQLSDKTEIDNHVHFIQDLITKTATHIQQNKNMLILGRGESNAGLNILHDITDRLNNALELQEYDSQINTINTDLCNLFKKYGTYSLSDLLNICEKTATFSYKSDSGLFHELLTHFHPISYKIVNSKPKDYNPENAGICELSTSAGQYYLQIHGVQVMLYNQHIKKYLLITGIIDNPLLNLIKSEYINKKFQDIRKNLPSDIKFHSPMFEQYLLSLVLKDFLIYSYTEIYSKFVRYLLHLQTFKSMSLNSSVKEFISMSLKLKRQVLVQLLLDVNSIENQYLTILLYNLIASDYNDTIDTYEQTLLLDSLSWNIKQNFRNTMNTTVEYTKRVVNFDMQTIPLEQQICLLKTTDSVKEKAIAKLKEVKSKSEESGVKARQYIDGLLKIPFNIYRKEPILNIMDDIKLNFKSLINVYPNLNISDKKYTNLEINNHILKIKKDLYSTELLIAKHTKGTVADLISNIENFNKMIDCKSLSSNKISSKSSKKTLITDITHFIETNSQLLNANPVNANIIKDVQIIDDKCKHINDYISTINTTLTNAIYGHSNAKKQIERIIGQWINGEQDGYCFGFEGAPGVGKTSLGTRGLSECLKDENGVSRPFAMIQMGGDCNGSSIHGHNYTYVGSTWGNIVQILMDKKCMNPIIFIDEIDKISKTEHGKEIIGILTHLLDPTQNSCFQDKYFNGIELNLSKALFILSYNDVEMIDKILLDRIHRIKFESISIDDKIIISNKHILPEIYKKMGLENVITISDETLRFIIEEYTSESGVRKLKEVLFEIIGEINLDILKTNFLNNQLIITIDQIKTNYFKKKRCIKHKKINDENKIGVINGLWANSMGQGGIIHIQSTFFPAKSMELKLTGMQGDVMKESMNVALTLAWNLTPLDIRDKICNGVHIHCPEGAVPKDGPSAGTAITITLFSLFNGKKIKRNIAITGEISLDGSITEIGGLDLKILGGIKAGVTEFIFPAENQADYDSYIEKYKTENVKFHAVKRIEEVLELIFE